MRSIIWSFYSIGCSQTQRTWATPSYVTDRSERWAGGSFKCGEGSERGSCSKNASNSLSKIFRGEFNTNFIELFVPFISKKLFLKLHFHFEFEEFERRQNFNEWAERREPKAWRKCTRAKKRSAMWNLPTMVYGSHYNVDSSPNSFGYPDIQKFQLQPVQKNV